MAALRVSNYCARSFFSFRYYHRIKLVASRNPLLYFPDRRYFSSYSRNFSILNKTFPRTLLIVAGSAVSLACVLVLQQNNSKVSCEKDSTEESVGSKPAKNIGTSKNNDTKPVDLNPAIDEARTYLEQVREVTGAPGIVVAVSINGKLAWSEGLGYSDVENHVKCNPDNVLRIASISKFLTAVATAKLYEEKKLDVDAPIQKYLPYFPQKKFNGKPVTITTRQLLCHLGGIRHYVQPIETHDKTSKQEGENSLKAEEKQVKPDNVQEKKMVGTVGFSRLGREHYIKEPKTMEESLALFQDDPLVCEPGESYNYSTHGYTLISAVVEAVAQEDFLSHMKKFFEVLGMNDTGPNLNEKITYNRSRFYQRDKKNGLINTPYVDNSYKWAGGGLQSTVKDLVKFGNAMLYAYQVKDSNGKNMLPGILKPETINEMLKKVDTTVQKDLNDAWYGWGCFVQPEKHTYGGCDEHQKFAIYHTGATVGALSIVMIRPNCSQVETPVQPPKGIVVAIITNIQQISKSLESTAEHVTDIFEKQLLD